MVRKKKVPETITVTPTKEVTVNATSLPTRAVTSSYGIQYQFNGDRSVNESCGYPDTITINDYFNTYGRNDIAKRIVEANPDYTWMLKPDITSKMDSSTTKFDRAVKSVFKKNKVYDYLRKLDVLSGIGRFAILVVGVNDNRPLEKPIGKATEITYLQPYGEDKVTISKVEDDPTSPRYGLPVIYSVTRNSNITQSSTVGTTNANAAISTVKVHYTRVIHVADECLDSDLFGYPRLEPVYNLLMNIQKLTGGSAEMFWRGGFPGVVYEVDPEARIPEDKRNEIQTAAEDFTHRFNRTIVTEGMKVRSLEQDLADPRSAFDINISLIASTTKIPQRLLIGSEQGKLASQQDGVTWYNRCELRRQDQGEERILRPFINKLMSIGILPQVDDYYVIWPEYETSTDQEKAEVFLKVTTGLNQYAQAKAIVPSLPIRFFLKYNLGISDDEIKVYEKMAGDISKNEVATQQVPIQEEVAED